jgi:hypothetical protein
VVVVVLVVLVVVNGNKPNEVPRLCIRSNETLSPLDPLRLQMRGWGLVGGIIDACLGMSWRCVDVEDSELLQTREGP